MLDKPAANKSATLQDRKWRPSYSAGIAAFFLPMHSALASFREEDSFDFHVFLVLSAMMIFVAAIFALLSWTIKKIFLQTSSWFPIISTLAFLLSLGLGAIGTFAIPQYESVYASFGSDLPYATQILFGARQLLWLPFILILALYHSTRDNPNKTRYFAAALFVEAGLSILTGSLLSLNMCKSVVIG